MLAIIYKIEKKNHTFPICRIKTHQLFSFSSKSWQGKPIQIVVFLSRSKQIFKLQSQNNRL